MKLFLDTANIEEIRAGVRLGVIHGITTNPSLVAKEPGRPFRDIILEIVDIVQGPVSAEVVSTDVEAMLTEARTFAGWSPFVVVKLPTTEAGIEACSILSREGIKTNLTLCFSVNQALLVALAGATYVSPFVGRLDDIGHDGMQLIADISEVYRTHGFTTKVLAASIRHPLHVTQAARARADVATIPYKVLQQMVKHPLTDIGQARFLEDWQKALEGIKAGTF